MKVKQSWIFLVGFCLIKKPVSGCVHPDLTEEFNLRDLDLNGVLDRDEICKTIQHNGNGEACEQILNDYDLNGNGNVTCQESVVASMAMQLVEVELGEALKSIFVEKPENCEEVTKREISTFLMADETIKNEIEAISFINTFDVDRDGIITCKGKYCS